MNHGKLEESSTAESIMLNLRTLSQDLNITLFAIHHTPKLLERAITMDTIKGSSVFAQESDFAVGVNRTDKKHRYIKNVFFRYANDNDEFVKEFDITENAWLSQLGDFDEDQILARSDRRLAFDKADTILNFFDNNPNIAYDVNEVVERLKPLTGLQSRQIQTHLSKLSRGNKLDNRVRGQYRSVKNVPTQIENSNE